MGPRVTDRFTIAAAVVVLALTVAGCGGDDDSGVTEDQVVDALNLRYEGNDNLYALPNGSDCIVTQILTSSDDFDSVDEGAADTAVASNEAGDVGVVFGGYTGFSPDECVGPAEDDLNDAF